jgi:hypothetical protein
MLLATPALADGSGQLNAGVAECKRLYGGADLKTCIAHVKEIVWTIQNPPRSAPRRLIQPNALYGLPY